MEFGVKLQLVSVCDILVNVRMSYVGMRNVVYIGFYVEVME